MLYINRQVITFHVSPTLGFIRFPTPCSRQFRIIFKSTSRNIRNKNANESLFAYMLPLDIDQLGLE